MRDIKAKIEYSVSDTGQLKLTSTIPLTDEEITEFRRVLPEGSNFLSPTLGEDSITYTLEEKYDSKLEASQRLYKRLINFEFFVRSRTELTIPCNLYINID